MTKGHNFNFLLLFSFSLFLFSNIIYVNGITIKTSTFQSVYQGPGGTVEKQFQNTQSMKKISPYFSVASFVITGTTVEKYALADSSNIQEVFGPPQIKVIKGSSVDPILFGSAASGYFFDSSLYWLELPELSIYFNCQENGFSVIEITINSTLIHNIDGVSKSVNEVIQIYLQKECYNAGFREGFTISKNENAVGDVVKHGVVQSKWSLDSEYYLYKDPIVIPENEHMSVFYIYISNPDYGNQYFDSPLITVDDPDTLYIKARGSAEKGGIASGLPETLVLFYTCMDKGSIEVRIEISIGFYGNLVFGFTKDCTPEEKGEAEEGEENKLVESGLINVGTTRSHYSNVVENNIASVEWRAEESLINVGKDDLTSIFYISTASGKEQPFLKPIVSVNPPNAFQITVTGPARNGAIATGNPQRLIINYICDRVSEAEVIVSIKLPGYETVEFGFNKQCKKLIRHTDHVWTANQLLFAMLVGVISILVVIFLLVKKSKQQNGKNKK